MAVDSKHPIYDENIDLWHRCRTSYEGEDAVKKGGTKYLPKADPLQTPQEYEAYKTRAAYFEAVGRTVDGYVGAIARKEHSYDLPPVLEDFFEDATGDGIGLDEFVKTLCRDAFLVSRGGVLVDFDADKDRPYLQFYKAEHILNWGDDFVSLMEHVFEPNPEDPSETIQIDQIRRLERTEGTYSVDIWRRERNAFGTGDWQHYEHIVPSRRGLPLGQLPFFWISSGGSTSRYTRPPLLGLVNMAMSHYRTSADLEHGRHFSALPTLYVTGYTSEEPIRVGSATAIILSDSASKVGYAEFNGGGLSSLEKALESKEHQMAVLGAAAFQESGHKRSQYENNASVRMRSSGDTTLLGSVVTAVEASLLTALKFAAEWAGGGEVDIKINREFLDTHLDAPTLTALVQGYIAGAVTVETFLFNLQQSDMLPPDTDITEESAQVKKMAADKAAQDLALKTAVKPTQSGIGDTE